MDQRKLVDRMITWILTAAGVMVIFGFLVGVFFLNTYRWGCGA